MKKNLLLLLLMGAMLTGCEGEFNYNPKKGGKYVPWEESEDQEEEEEEIVTCTYNFYFSYSHTTLYDEALQKDVSTPIFTLRDVNMFEPIGKIPEPIDTKEELIDKVKEKGYPESSIDSTFDKFIGFSAQTVCLDEDGLWNFTTDIKQQAIISLYGIWVSE